MSPVLTSTSTLTTPKQELVSSRPLMDQNSSLSSTPSLHGPKMQTPGTSVTESISIHLRAPPSSPTPSDAYPSIPPLFQCHHPSQSAVYLLRHLLKPEIWVSIIDNQLILASHIRQVCKTSFHHIWRIGRIRHLIDTATTKCLVNAFVLSRIDNANSLYHGLPGDLLDLLQRVLNAAARLTLKSRKC